MADSKPDDSKGPADERAPLLSSGVGPSSTAQTPGLPTASGTATPANRERPRTVRHHRRTLSGRSIQSGYFGPSYGPGVYPSHNDPFTRQAKRAADRRARSRFIKALAAGLGLWLLIGVIAGWTGVQQYNGRNRLDYGAKPNVPSSEGAPFSCANWTSTDDPFSAPLPRGYKASSSRFHVPFTSLDRFFVHGQGSFAKGKLKIEVVEDPSWDEDSAGKAKEGTAVVDVEARFNDDRLLDLMQVCSVVGAKEEYTNGSSTGLGIYTPKPEVGPYPDQDLDFAIRVRIPTSVASLYTLEVRGELLAIDAADLTAIDLDRLDFESSVARIDLFKVRAHDIRIRSTNGAISGHFNVSRSLSLASSNGAVRAKVALFPRSKDDDKIPDLPPNPPEDGDKLQSPKAAKAEKEPTTVHATTTNGAVGLEYVEHPVGQTLYSYAASTNGKVTVTHPPAFEGAFEAETTWGSATIHGPEEQDDPSGKGRERKKAVTTDEKEIGYRHIVGTVWWGEKGGDEDASKRGDTMIKTTLGSASIFFL